VSFQQLHRDGCKLLGKSRDVSEGKLLIEPDLVANIVFADTASARNKTRVDQYIEKSGTQAPPAEDDPVERPVGDLGGADAVTSIDLAEQGVGSVIWATGFSGDFSWLKVPAVDASGSATHELGSLPMREPISWGSLGLASESPGSSTGWPRTRGA
jgi:putative flavoprotein involved in K+ transport